MRYINFNSCNGRCETYGKSSRLCESIHQRTGKRWVQFILSTYQVEEIERYCKENNLELLGIYKDEGISGAKKKEQLADTPCGGLRFWGDS